MLINVHNWRSEHFRCVYTWQDIINELFWSRSKNTNNVEFDEWVIIQHNANSTPPKLYFLTFPHYKYACTCSSKLFIYHIIIMCKYISNSIIKVCSDLQINENLFPYPFQQLPSPCLQICKSERLFKNNIKYKNCWSSGIERYKTADLQK